MAWACMASSGTGSLAFTADVTEERRSQKTEGFMDILCTHIQPNAEVDWTVLSTDG